jgi:hypothetical protein
LAIGTRAAIGRHPIPELCLGPDEASAMFLRIVPSIFPNAVNQQTHPEPPSEYVLSTTELI